MIQRRSSVDWIYRMTMKRLRKVCSCVCEQGSDTPVCDLLLNESCFTE